MPAHQKILVNLDVFVAVPGETEKDAFKYLDTLPRKEVLLMALTYYLFFEVDEEELELELVSSSLSIH